MFEKHDVSHATEQFLIVATTLSITDKLFVQSKTFSQKQVLKSSCFVAYIYIYIVAFTVSTLLIRNPRENRAKNVQTNFPWKVHTMQKWPVKEDSIK